MGFEGQYRFWFACILAGIAASTAALGQDFETQVKPVLRSNCLACHRQEGRNSGLALDSRKEALAGGNRGPAIEPGKPDESLLIRAVEQKGDLKMPPGRKLKDDQIAVLRKWIEQGAEWPVDTTAKKPKGWDHWAFQAPKHSDAPTVQNSGWASNAIDRFILARLEREGVAPSPAADKYTLLRRVSLDITGLPPTLAELQAFVNDRSPQAYEKVVDRLLSSPHYGERWARHWLDLARYSDSDGYTIDDPRQIWKYRDWVISSLNKDQPYSQFVVEQLAGDMLPNPTTDQLVATGFHRNTPSNYEGGIDFEQYRNEAVADRVATTGAGILGLSLGCARCHDHKYDPVTQREFYQIYAYFNNTDEITTEAERPQFNRPILPIPTADDNARLDEWNKEVAELSRETAAAAKKAGSGKEVDSAVKEAAGKLATARRNKPANTSTLIMRELPSPRPTFIQLGGDFTRKGAPVTPATFAFIEPKLQGGTRLDFAKWIVDERNPLTARVAVNRIWQAYFGKGLVDSENDFGLNGSKPTHPELLDWLATEFMNSGWSQKAVHRLIAMSSTYRQSSRGRSDLDEKDPYNLLLARQSRLRMEAEIVRDSALTASGLLNPAVGGKSVYPPIASGAMQGTQIRKVWPTAFGPDRFRRGLYTFSYRSNLFPGLGLFDAPDGQSSCTRRVRSNTPLQALALLNDTSSIEFARALGMQLAQERADDKARIERGFLMALGRLPTERELERLRGFVSLQRDEFSSDASAAKKLLGAGEARALLEAEEAASAKPGGAQAPTGKRAGDELLRVAAAERALGKKLMEQRTAELESKSEAEVREMAAWTAVSRVLLNLDDFMTRN